MLGVALLTSLCSDWRPRSTPAAWTSAACSMKSGRGIAGTRRKWMRGALVAAEVALSLVLLMGAGLMVRTLGWLNSLNPGFDPHNVLAAEASLQDARYRPCRPSPASTPKRWSALRRIPGVSPPPWRSPCPTSVRSITECGPWTATDRETHTGEFVYATPAYFETMRIPCWPAAPFAIPILPRRARVVVVSQSFARKYFHGDALGRHLRVGVRTISEIVGICGDVQQHSGLSGDEGPLSMEPTVYLPASQTQRRFRANWSTPGSRRNGWCAPAVPRPI